MTGHFPAAIQNNKHLQNNVCRVMEVRCSATSYLWLEPTDTLNLLQQQLLLSDYLDYSYSVIK